MNKRALRAYRKLTNNGVIGYLTEKEIKTMCKNIFPDKEVGAELAEDAIQRSKNINDVTVSKIAM